MSLYSTVAESFLLTDIIMRQQLAKQHYIIILYHDTYQNVLCEFVPDSHLCQMFVAGQGFPCSPQMCWGSGFKCRPI